jgi:hypothetical protein
MINPKFRTPDGKARTFDVVEANAMWNQPFNQDIFKNDPFERFSTAGGITSGKGEWAWLQHSLACMNDRGRRDRRTEQAQTSCTQGQNRPAKCLTASEEGQA